MDISKHILKLEERFHIKINQPSDLKRKRVSTGVLGLDYLANGGIIKGKFTAIYGKQGSMKTTLGVKMIVEAQKRGTCIIVDVEKSLDDVRLIQLGIDIDKAIILRHNSKSGVGTSGEAFFDAIIAIMRIIPIEAVLIDSVSMMSSEYELGKNVSDKKTLATSASMLSVGFRMLHNTMGDSTDVIIIAHEKNNPTGIGAKSYMTGGESLQFYPHYVFNVRKGNVYDKDWCLIGDKINKERELDKEVYGCEITVIGKKIKNAPGNKNINLLISMETGEPRKGYEILKVGMLMGFINLEGNTYKINDIGIKCVGFDKFAKLLDDDTEMYNKVYNFLIEKIKNNA